MGDTYNSALPQFVLPRVTDAALYRAVLDAVEASQPDQESAGAVPLVLSSAGEDPGVALPAGLVEVLVHAASALSDGRAVTFDSIPETISTRKTAELLGLRHSTVIELLAEGQLTADPSSTGRPRLRLTDVLTYRDELHERRSQFIAETF